MKRFILCALLISINPVFACINDRDTLAQEAAAQKADSSGLPNVVRVITGRFERNPPSYYQMRLERVAKALKADPTQLDLYDDAGAACDRLGRSKDALEWMEKKRRQLDVSNADAKAKREHEYRYFANAGTFHAHLWLRSGANRANMQEMRTGRDMIKRAIEIKPDAHFGREKYQLLLMEWVLNPPPQAPDNYVNDFLELTRLNQDDNQDHLSSSNYPDAITGLSGLIVLGDAWASFDVYHALMQALGAQGKASLSTLAGQRCLELLDNGRSSLSPNFSFDQSTPVPWKLNWPQTEASADEINRKYFELRSDSMKYQSQRTLYMVTRLSKGIHPDTHPEFWNSWKEPPLPSLEMPDLARERREQFMANIKRIGQFLMVGLVALSAGIFVGRRRALN